MSTFLENLPRTVEAKVESRKDREEKVLIQVATDMAGEDRFEQRWLVVTSKRLMVLDPNGASGDVEFSLQAVKSARIEALVGGGRLELEREEGAPTHLYYSNSLAPKFAEVAEGIEQLKEGQDLNLPHELDRTHCEQCGRRLPEIGGICPVCIAKFDTFKRLIGYMLPYRFQLALLLSLTVASSLLELAPPYIVKHLIDDVLVPGTEANMLYWLVGGLFVIGVVEWCVGVVRRWLNVRVGFRAIEHLRTDLFKALQYLPLRFYDKRKVGALISRMNNDSEMVEDYLLFDMPYIVSNAAMIVGILGLLFYMNWELTLYVLAPVPPIVIGSSLIWNRLQRFWGRWSARWSRLTTHLNESISGIRVVKAFAQEHRESERFDQRNHALRQISVSAERSWLVFFMVTNFFMSFGGFFVWYFGGQQIVGGDLSLGELMAFIAYLWMLYHPLKWFGDFYSFMVRAFAGAERIFEIVDAPSEPFDHPSAQRVPALEGQVAFEGAAFGYDPGKIVLRDLDLVVQPGEMIGLVGKSGDGQEHADQPNHALLRCLARPPRHRRGRYPRNPPARPALADRHGGPAVVFVQRHDCRKHRVRQARCHVRRDFARGPRGQRPRVHRQTPRRVRHGRRGAGRQARRRREAAHFHCAGHSPRPEDPDLGRGDFIARHADREKDPRGHSAAGQRPHDLSPLPTGFRRLRSADRLVVLDGGKIAEIGTHEELMAREGIFYNLVKTQRETSAVMATSG